MLYWQRIVCCNSLHILQQRPYYATALTILNYKRKFDNTIKYQETYSPLSQIWATLRMLVRADVRRTAVKTGKQRKFCIWHIHLIFWMKNVFFKLFCIIKITDKHFILLKLLFSQVYFVPLRFFSILLYWLVKRSRWFNV